MFLPREFIVPIIVSIVIFAVAIVGIVYAVRYRRQFVYNYRSHEIIVRITSRSLSLLVDGKVEDEFAAQNIRLCTLRTLVEGEEIKARIEVAFRPRVEVTAGGNALMCISMGK